MANEMVIAIAVLLTMLCSPLVVLHAAAGSCDDYKCVQGKCVETSGFPPVKCVCDAGWSNILGMSFLSCVIPNCSFDLECAKASKVDDNPPATNSSGFDIFNPCTYSVCGKGDCIRQKDSDNGYTCRCHQGYANLLNSSNGICIADCSLGADCQQLGIGLGGPTSSPSNKQNSSATVTASPADTRQFHTLETSLLVLVLGIFM